MVETLSMNFLYLYFYYLQTQQLFFSSWGGNIRLSGITAVVCKIILGRDFIHAFLYLYLYYLQTQQLFFSSWGGNIRLSGAAVCEIIHGRDFIHASSVLQNVWVSLDDFCTSFEIYISKLLWKESRFFFNERKVIANFCVKKLAGCFMRDSYIKRWIKKNVRPCKQILHLYSCCKNKKVIISRSVKIR